MCNIFPLFEEIKVIFKMHFLIFGLFLLPSMVQGSPVDESSPVDETPVAESVDKFGSIVKGQNAKKGTYPYHVGIVYRRVGYACGGSIISPYWILTAAHCVASSTEADYTILAGDHDISSNDGETKYYVGKIIRHEKWTIRSNNYDIALLKLKKPIELISGYTQTINLLRPVEKVIAGEKAIITGWGRLRWGGPKARILQVAEIEITSSDDCKRKYNIFRKEHHICAGKDDGSKDACSSDSGGPMVVKRKDTWVQAGIIIFGFKCAVRGYPGVYTYVPNFYEWIQNQMKNN